MNIFLKTALVSFAVVAFASAGFIYAFNGPGSLTAGTGTGALSALSNGNVGIGTTTPPQKLFVNGNAQATTFIGAFSGAISANNVSAGTFGLLQGNGNFAFPASLSVGTSTAGQALYVLGSIQQTAVTNSVLAADATGKLIATTTSGGGSVQKIQTFTTGGTWTAPTGVTRVLVTVQGGGGGGSGGYSGDGTANNYGVGGAGGGSGALSRKWLTVTSGTGYTVTVGTGGSGSAASSELAANNGGASSFGALLSANGGTGGGAANHTYTSTVGGAGGAAQATGSGVGRLEGWYTDWITNVPGGDGGAGGPPSGSAGGYPTIVGLSSVLSSYYPWFSGSAVACPGPSTYCSAGGGGASFNGNGGNAGYPGASAAANSGAGGGGGRGSTDSGFNPAGAGGNGGSGVVIVEWVQ